MPSNNNFRIEKISVVDQVCDALKERIISGEFKPGDKLPAESVIAETYGVNRLSVRMALQKLNTLGIIETLTGTGSFVKQFSFSSVLGEMADFIASGTSINEVAELRYLLERACSLKAVENTDPAEADALANICEKFCLAYDAFEVNPTNENADEYLKADFALHAQIVHMSGNKLLEELYATVQGLIQMHIFKLITERRSKDELRPNYYKDLHISLCEAIISHNRSDTKQKLIELLDVEKIDSSMF